MKKIVSFLLCVSMVLSATTIAFAGKTEIALKDGTVGVMKISDNILIIENGKDKALVQSEERIDHIKITVSGIDGNAEENFLIYNKNDNCMYSSYTDKKFSISDIPYTLVKSTIANSNIVERKNYYITYAKLANAVTPTSSQVSIVSALIAIIAASQGITIATAATVVVTFFSTPAWDEIRKGIVDRSTDHGIKITVVTIEIQKHQGGRIVKGYRYAIESVETY